MESLKAIFDRNNVTGILESAGYELDRQHRFRMREERTASAVVNIDGTVHDYGSDFYGDIFDVLKSRGMSFPDVMIHILTVKENAIAVRTMSSVAGSVK